MKSAYLHMAVLSMAAIAPIRAQTANPDSLLVQEFEDRVKQYVKLRKHVEAMLPPLKPTASPEKIARHEHELAEKIRAARPGSVQGNVFTANIAAELRRLIAIAMQGQEAAHVQQSLQHAEPVNLRLQAGATYPAQVPLQSTPPTLLMNLPPLPPEVDYRVVAKALVLRDVNANLIVDFISDALP